jgi:hypothetical protein
VELLFNWILGKDYLINRVKESLESSGAPYKTELAILLEKDILGLIIMAVSIVVLVLSLIIMFGKFGILKKIVLIASLASFMFFFGSAMDTIRVNKFEFEEEKLIAQKYVEQARAGETFDMNCTVLRENFQKWNEQKYVDKSFLEAESYGLSVNASGTKLLITYKHNGKEVITDVPGREIDRIVNSYVYVDTTIERDSNNDLYILKNYLTYSPAKTVLMCLLILLILLLAFTKNSVIKKVLIFVFVVSLFYVYADVGLLSTKENYKQQVVQCQVDETIRRLKAHEFYEISEAVIRKNRDEWVKMGYMEQVDMTQITYQQIDFDDDRLYYWYQLKGYGYERFKTKLNSEQILMFLMFYRPLPFEGIDTT